MGIWLGLAIYKARTSEQAATAELASSGGLLRLLGAVGLTVLLCRLQFPNALIPFTPLVV